MSITLQRRHGPGCAAARKLGSYSFETDEHKRGARVCECRIYGVGTLAGEFRRYPTKERSWELARAVIQPFIDRGRWNFPLTDPPDPPPAKPEEKGIRLGDAVADFLKEHERAGSAPKTIKQYRQVLERFSRAAFERGYRFIEEWTKPDIRGWRESMVFAPKTIKNYNAVLATFFQCFVDRDVLQSNPARFRMRMNRSLLAEGERIPFSNEEIERMLTGCKWISRIVSKNVVPIAGGYSGDDLADFIEVGLYTGLRISDIATFDSSRITDSGEVNVRALKNGRWVSVWIPDWLRDRIEWRAQRYGRKIFPTNTNGLDSACELWRQRLNRLWKITGPWERRPTPHRLRHTFIRLLLERGLPLAMVAELAGDTEQVIQRHYSSFVPSRQKAISDAMRAAFANAPRFHR